TARAAPACDPQALWEAAAVRGCRPSLARRGEPSAVTVLVRPGGERELEIIVLRHAAETRSLITRLAREDPGWGSASCGRRWRTPWTAPPPSRAGRPRFRPTPLVEADTTDSAAVAAQPRVASHPLPISSGSARPRVFPPTRAPLRLQPPHRSHARDGPDSTPALAATAEGAGAPSTGNPSSRHLPPNPPIPPLPT